MNSASTTTTTTATSSISRLSRLCRRSPVRMQTGGSSSGSANNAAGQVDWTSFRRQMSYSSEFGSAVGESFLVVDEIQESRLLQQHQLQHHHGSQGSSLLLQHHLRSESVSPDPSARLIDPCSSGLAYLERGTLIVLLFFFFFFFFFFPF